MKKKTRLCYTNNSQITFVDFDGCFGKKISSIIKRISNYFIEKDSIQKETAMEKVNNLQKEKREKTQKACLLDNVKFENDLKNNAQKVKARIGNAPPLTKYGVFALWVRPGGIYDYKIGKYAGKTIYYDGMWMEAEDIGNYHYGYIGRAAGIPKSVLVVAGGFVQLLQHGEDTIENCPTTSFCDDPRDTYFVQKGADAYDKENN